MCFYQYLSGSKGKSSASKRDEAVQKGPKTSKRARAQGGNQKCVGTNRVDGIITVSKSPWYRLKIDELGRIIQKIMHLST